MRRWMIGIAALAAAGQAWAATLSPGTYMLEGGSYQIAVEAKGGNLVVVEPNKTSTYTPASDGSYQFTNPNNGITYGLRVIDDHTIEAFKPGSGNPGTKLTRLGGAPGGGAAPVSEESDKWSDLASSYSGKIASDPANTQAWAACAAVAMKRATASKAEADTYARQMVGMLKQLDAKGTPCSEVITTANWN